MGEHWCGLFQWQAAMVFSPWQDCQRRVLALARQPTTGRSFDLSGLKGVLVLSLRYAPENVAGIEVVAAYFEPGKSKWKFPIRGQTI